MITPDDFSEFGYSKRGHFQLLRPLAMELHREKDPRDLDLKAYQDMLILAFIRDNVPPGARILEIGGGDSRIIRHLCREYEIWNLDRLAGVGNGPLEDWIWKGPFNLVKDYIGNFNPRLPDNHFDFVFSISVLEHVPQDSLTRFEEMRQDMNRVLKHAAFSLHCWDVKVNPQGTIGANSFLPYLYSRQAIVPPYSHLEAARNDPDLFSLSERLYDRHWKPIIHREYVEFGKPFSFNTLWRKPGAS